MAQGVSKTEQGACQRYMRLGYCPENDLCAFHCKPVPLAEQPTLRDAIASIRMRIDGVEGEIIHYPLPYGGVIYQRRDLEALRLALATLQQHERALAEAGKRVWSDTEESAYQAGVSDTRARLQEPDVREAIKAAMREKDFARDGEYLPDDCYEAFADAALTKIAEILT
jgi:hypothetical protein